MKLTILKLFFAFLLIVLLTIPFSSKLLATSSNTPQVTFSTNNSTQNIHVSFPQSVPAGNIVDIEVHDSANSKVWQYASTSGGSDFSAAPPLLANGIYTISVGIFTSNWSSNTNWWDHIATLSVNTQMGTSITTPSITPTITGTVSPIAVNTTSPSPSPIQNSQAQTTAQNAYNDWKNKYISWNGNLARVVRPENNNDTVSEGIGYGMLLAAFAKDQNTFNGLYQYMQKYLDSKGLMNWQISSGGSIIGQGSATDADEDIAYALIKGNALWPGNGYDTAAKKMIGSMKSTEVVNNYLNPGDNWGGTAIMNPSYIAPSYYKAFALFTGDSQWNVIASKNSSWLSQAANASTGLLSDWLNNDMSQANIGFDAHKNDFYYDALRTPIRLLMAQKSGDTNAANILQKQSNFFSGIGADKLVAGYTLSGQGLSTYIDTAFLSSYTAASQINPSSIFAQIMLQKLTSTAPSGYFGTSLRALTLFIIAGNY